MVYCFGGKDGILRGQGFRANDRVRMVPDYCEWMLDDTAGWARRFAGGKVEVCSNVLAQIVRIDGWNE